MKHPFWTIKIGAIKSVSHFCLITGVELLDCGNEIVGGLLLLSSISEVFGQAGTLGDCRMSQFIHHG